MTAPMQDFNWYGPERDNLGGEIDKGDTLKAVLGLVFALLAFALIALGFWFEARG